MIRIFWKTPWRTKIVFQNFHGYQYLHMFHKCLNVVLAEKSSHGLTIGFELWDLNSRHLLAYTLSLQGVGPWNLKWKWFVHNKFSKHSWCWSCFPALSLEAWHMWHMGTPNGMKSEKSGTKNYFEFSGNRKKLWIDEPRIWMIPISLKWINKIQSLGFISYKDYEYVQDYL